MLDIQKVNTFGVYNLISLEINIHLWNHHHNQGHKIIHPPKVSSQPLLLKIIFSFVMRAPKIYHRRKFLSIQVY